MTLLVKAMIDNGQTDTNDRKKNQTYILKFLTNCPPLDDLKNDSTKHFN